MGVYTITQAGAPVALSTGVTTSKGERENYLQGMLCMENHNLHVLINTCMHNMHAQYSYIH
jgi:hypothetical protein